MKRTAALVAVFAAVVLVGAALATLGGAQGWVRPIAPVPSSPPAAPASRSPEPHPDFVVTPGAFCEYEGANGATKDGTPMRCVRKPGEDRPRWRSDG